MNGKKRATKKTAKKQPGNARELAFINPFIPANRENCLHPY